jgi:hypothetical protein
VSPPGAATARGQRGGGQRGPAAESCPPSARGIDGHSEVTSQAGAPCWCLPGVIVTRRQHHLNHSLKEDARVTMSKSKRRKPSSRQRPTKPGARRAAVLTVTVVLVVGICAAVVLLRGGALGGTGSPLASPIVPGGQLAATAVTATASFQSLRGRWLRPDGGYILDIQDVDASGKIEAVYLNPRPIHVARAEATGDGAALQVFVELRGPGYPGSTYTLRYEPQRDQLEGIYFQAALQQRFAVVFVRMK